MQARLEELQKEMDAKDAKAKENKMKRPAKTPTPKHGAPSPASSKATPTPKSIAQASGHGDDSAGSESETGGELTKAAKLNRLRRLCERKPSGKLNVPEEVHRKWAAKGHEREQLLEILEGCGWHTDRMFVNISHLINIECDNALLRWPYPIRLTSSIPYMQTHLTAILPSCNGAPNHQVDLK